MRIPSDDRLGHARSIASSAGHATRSRMTELSSKISRIAISPIRIDSGMIGVTKPTGARGIAAAVVGVVCDDRTNSGLTDSCQQQEE